MSGTRLRQGSSWLLRTTHQWTLRPSVGLGHGLRLILRDRELRTILGGYGLSLAIVSLGIGCLLVEGAKDGLAVPGLLAASGLVIGAVLPGLQRHPRRRLGLVPIFLSVLPVTLAWGSVAADLRWPLFVVGLGGSIVAVPLHSSYRALVPAECRRSAMALLNGAYCFATSLMAAATFALTRLHVIALRGTLSIVAVIAGVGAMLAWRLLYREVVEVIVEILLWPIYRIRAEPGSLDRFPLRGPVLVVANHSAWMDPIWLSKVLPRGITPMMTSVFYDLPVMRWLMVHLIRAIRVEASNYRREAPELQQAVAALDRGECVLIFPEGCMRRREDQLIRPFAQGPWHILRERPQTPVVVCWIEGGWGSFFSYRGGRPTKNKRFDWWRTIRISAEEPHVVDPAILTSLRTTRIYLMRACLQARRHLAAQTLPLHPQMTEEACVLQDEEPVAQSA